VWGQKINISKYPECETVRFTGNAPKGLGTTENHSALYTLYRQEASLDPVFERRQKSKLQVCARVLGRAARSDVHRTWKDMRLHVLKLRKSCTTGMS
jgi:hypothetical protein